MRMKIPITGTVKQVEGGILGDDDDPITIVNIDLGPVSWTLVNLDLDAEEMEIEVKLDEVVPYDTGEIDERGRPIWVTRSATEEEKNSRREVALNHSLSRMSAQALYALSKSPRLKNPLKTEPE